MLQQAIGYGAQAFDLGSPRSKFPFEELKKCMTELEAKKAVLARNR
jgi:hypothetical protein